MSDHEITQFNSLESLKRAAKQLKKKEGLKHTEALELVSKLAGYADYCDALRCLNSRGGAA